MRNMSFSMTEAAFLDGTKTVTRRLGWGYLKAGDRVRAVRKAQGLKKGEHVHVLGIIQVEDVWFQPLGFISQVEVTREGYPHMHRDDFVRMFCKAMSCDEEVVVTRIAFRRIT